MGERIRYYHGGQKGLPVGGYILPPAESGAKHTLYETAVRERLDSPARLDLVYVTRLYAAALLYGALHPSGGAVYEVEPDGTLEPDPDCNAPGLSWQCAKARIVRVFKIREGERRRVIRAITGGVAA